MLFATLARLPVGLAGFTECFFCFTISDCCIKGLNAAFCEIAGKSIACFSVAGLPEAAGWFSG
jgi:hypothetical protein